jgi:restriction system protein
MSEGLRNTTGTPGTIRDVSNYSSEIEKLLDGAEHPQSPLLDENVENPTAFALEKHLEDFLIDNWSQTDLGKMYDIFEEDGEKVGQQYATDTGPLDILAISKDKKQLLVVELKKGRASDAVVGQILRYIGYVSDELAEPGQSVCGVIIALEDDQKIRRALSVVPQVVFYRYEISFKLIPT